eukprot:2817986-Pleurochrysis_carterae.AAC.1
MSERCERPVCRVDRAWTHWPRSACRWLAPTATAALNAATLSSMESRAHEETWMERWSDAEGPSRWARASCWGAMECGV